MSDQVIIAIAAVIYTLVAVRIGFVFIRARRRHGLDNAYILCCVQAAIWPLTAYMLGFVISVGGEAGIFDSAIPSEHLGCEK